MGIKLPATGLDNLNHTVLNETTCHPEPRADGEGPQTRSSRHANACVTAPAFERSLTFARDDSVFYARAARRVEQERVARHRKRTRSPAPIREWVGTRRVEML